jgi:hypothetical protein
MRMIAMLTLFVFTSLFQAHAKESAEQTVRTIWQDLAELFNPGRQDCTEVHTWLPDLGVRGFYCHVKGRLDYAGLVELIGMPAFREGPHDENSLDLQSLYDFGHYNPAFVERLHHLFLPALKDPEFIVATQEIYNQYIGSLARTFFVVYQELHSDRAYLDAQLKRYQHFMNARQANYFDNEYYYFAALENLGFEGYEVQTAVLFWLRRHLDGTDGLFFSALSDLLALYDSGFLEMRPSQLSQGRSVVSVEEAIGTVQTVFPEAYTQFMQVSFEYQDSNDIWPAQAQFFVAARYFPAPLDAQTLQERAVMAAQSLAPSDMAVCPSAESGAEEEAAWQAWDEETVRKVQINFGFGC